MSRWFVTQYEKLSKNKDENFKNKNFIIDLSGSIENNKGKKDINKIDRLLKLFAKI